MEQREGRDDAAREPSAPPGRRRRRRHLSLVHKTVHPLAELPALIEHLRHEEDAPEEAERLRRLAERADRWREEMPVVETPIEEWIHAEQDRRGIG